jgi:galactitol-specific phosphotransferase system IIB component
MARAPQKVRLQKTLKEGLRRCVYQRWEATIKGAALITTTTELERMYRGNTPYPVGKPKVTRRAYGSSALAKSALQRVIIRRKAEGYRAS